MATKNEAKTETNTPKRQKRLKKSLALYTPFISWHPGLVLFGEITRKFENTTKFGAKMNIEIELLDDEVQYHNADGEVVTLKKGDRVNVGATAALNAVMTLDVGTKVEIECTGKTETPRGQSWDFEVGYE